MRTTKSTEKYIYLKKQGSWVVKARSESAGGSGTALVIRRWSSSGSTAGMDSKIGWRTEDLVRPEGLVTSATSKTERRTLWNITVLEIYSSSLRLL